MKLFRQIALVLLVVGTALGVLYIKRDSLLLTLTSHQLERQAKALFGAPLAYREKRLEGALVVFEEPSCNGGKFRAERLTLEPSWLPCFSGVSIKARMTAPRLAPSARPFAMSKRRSLRLPKLLQVKWECVVEGGEVASESQPFSGRVWNDDAKRIHAAIEVGEGSLQMDVRKRRITFSMEHIPLGLLAPFLGSEAHGDIEGNGTFHLPKRGLPWMEGGITVADLSWPGLTAERIEAHLSPKKRRMGRLNGWRQALAAHAGAIAICGATWEREGLAWEGGGEIKEGRLSFHGFLNGSEALVEGTLDPGKLAISWSGGERFEISEGLKGRLNLLCHKLRPYQTCLFNHSPMIHKAGAFSGKVTAQVKKGEIHNVWIKEIVSSHLRWQWGDVEGSVEAFAGHLWLRHLKPGWERDCWARVELEGGFVRAPNLSANELEGAMLIQNGTFERLDLEGEVNGLTFRASAPMSKEAHTIQCHVEGAVADLNRWPALPFEGETFTLDATLTRGSPSLLAEGLLEIGNDRLPFGFTLSPKGRTGLPPLLGQLAGHLLPPPRSWAGSGKPLAFQKGWINGAQVSAATYFQPLLSDQRMKLFGTVDFQATFDGKELAIDYEGCDMRLEAPLFRITTPQVGGPSVKSRHRLNLASGCQKGRIPLREATYLEKHSGLVFSHIRAEVDLLDGNVRASEMEGICEGIAFVGETWLDRQVDQPTHLKLIAKRASGPLTGAQKLLARLSDSPLWQPPTGGTVYLEEGGLTLSFTFHPEEICTDLSVKGRIREGCWESGYGFAIQDLQTFFAYEHEGGHLSFEKLSALSLFEGNASQPLQAPHLTFSHFPRGEGRFSITLGELARLKGELTDRNVGERELTITHAHFGGIQLGIQKCLLNHDYSLKEISLLPAIELSTLSQDLRLIHQITGLPLELPLKTFKPELLSGEIVFSSERGWQGQLAAGNAFFAGYGSQDTWEIAARAGPLSAFICKQEGLSGSVAWEEMFSCLLMGQFDSGQLSLNLHNVILGNAPIAEPIILSHSGNDTRFWLPESLPYPIRKAGGISGRLDYAPSQLSVILDGGDYLVDGYPVSLSQAQIVPHFNTQMVNAHLCFPTKEAIDLSWNLAGEKPFLSAIQGAFKGIEVQLSGEPDTSALFGTCTIAGPEYRELLPPLLSSLFEKAQIGSGYQLCGRFELPQLSFTGELTGRSFEAFGYRFDRLSSHIIATPHALSLHSLHLDDHKGKVSVDRLEAKFCEGEWAFTAPAVRVWNLQPHPPLTITSGEIQNFSGGAHPSTWTGVGSFSFIRPEISNSALQSLAPAAGRVAFSIGGGRCQFSRLDHAHSWGHRSLFYLASDAPSYIDFEGNVSLRLRTKQSNLVLKVAERFTFAIGGTLDKPTLRLQPAAQGAAKLPLPTTLPPLRGAYQRRGPLPPLR